MRKLLFVCLGNICRSPLAEGSFNQIARERGLQARLMADSAGTAGYHVGQQPDPRTIKVAENHGIELTHLGRKLSPQDFDDFDSIVVMDEENFEFVHTLYYDTKGAPPSTEKLFLIRDFDPTVKGVHNVIDPYYESMEVFESVYQTLKRCNESLITYLDEKYIQSSSESV